MCAKSSKEQVMSVNEQAEQHAIESSVYLDKESERVVVQLPFTKDPIAFLSKRHRGQSNYGQARRIYEAQCRKAEATKAGIRSTHNDLLEKGFMKKLSDLPSEDQEIVANAGFRHFMPWRFLTK